MAEREDLQGLPARENLDLGGLDRALEHLYRARAAVGLMPPAPATRRGRWGGVLVRLVRRSLFWLLPQLEAFHSAMIQFAESQTALMEELRGLLADVDTELATLRQELQFATGATAGAPVDPAGELWLKLIRCQAAIDTVRHGIRGSGGAA
jgi:hypothetical protein